MSKKMIIDATRLEETRVAILNNGILDEYDFETADKKQLKGNIYLAKVTRVEPSLQACFVDYGGNRHGFLAFTEIHPDYFQIPVADRERLQKELEDIENLMAQEATQQENQPHSPTPEQDTSPESGDNDEEPSADTGTVSDPSTDDGDEGESHPASPQDSAETSGGADDAGGSDLRDEQEKRRERLFKRMMRNYRIQEVIKKNQVILIQVNKEERGNKGAALTTYLSLAGRYCVLMPNTRGGGGVSRKIGTGGDRKRLKEIIEELSVPIHMSVIVRTAGEKCTKPEIKRDYQYLEKLWDQIREDTLKATAPALIYEEGSLIKRTLRDVMTGDVEEILIQGKEGCKLAKAFIKMLMPAQVKKVKEYDDPIPIFQKFDAERLLEEIYSPTVQLRSGGYIVINQTEALVAIDVNSGRATRERDIEKTALRTNLEAADEVARQLRLRDLSGLIIIDFIDMISHGNTRKVEKRMRDALRHDRARVQSIRISDFGLMQISRQRLRPSISDMMLDTCPTCKGMGKVPSPHLTASGILRKIEEISLRHKPRKIRVEVAGSIAVQLLSPSNRRYLSEIELKTGIPVDISHNSTLDSFPFYDLKYDGGEGEQRDRDRGGDRDRHRGGDRHRHRGDRDRGGRDRDRDHNRDRDQNRHSHDTQHDHGGVTTDETETGNATQSGGNTAPRDDTRRHDGGHDQNRDRGGRHRGGRNRHRDRDRNRDRDRHHGREHHGGGDRSPAGAGDETASGGAPSDNVPGVREQDNRAAAPRAPVFQEPLVSATLPQPEERTRISSTADKIEVVEGRPDKPRRGWWGAK